MGERGRVEQSGRGRGKEKGREEGGAGGGGRRECGKEDDRHKAKPP